jgi:hypothetical protein
MTLRTSVSAIAAAALASCAEPGIQQPMSTFQCQGARCDVAVKVVEVTVGGRCEIQFEDTTQLELSMPRATRNVVIRWTLDAASAARYEFEADGFALKGGKTSGQFRLKPGAVADGRAYQLTNLNSDGRKHEYQMRVRDKTHDERSCWIDPLIHNMN